MGIRRKKLNDFVTFANDNRMKKLVCILACFSMIMGGSQLLAQKRNEAGFVVGDSYYLGELNPGCHFLNNHLTAGVFYKRNFSDRISLKIASNYTTLSGNDTATFHYLSNDIVGMETRKGSFTTSIVDMSAVCEINFLKYFTGASKNFWSPYLLVGVGATYQLSLDGSFVGESGDSYYTNMTGVGYDTLMYQKPGNLSVNFNFGCGVKYSLSEKIGIFAEWMVNKTFVDWLDGFYQEMPNKSVYDSYNAVQQIDYDKKMVDVQNICNTANKDWYFYFQVGLSFAFNFNNKNVCYDHLR